MKKLLTLVAVLIGFMASAQKTTPGNYTYIAQKYEWDAGVFKGLGLPAGPGPAAFIPGQVPRAGAVYYDSVGVDSGFYVYTGTYWRNHSITGGGSTNTNVGAFYRWLKPDAQEIKTFANGYGILIDSSTNTDALTARVDTFAIATKARVMQVADSLGAIGGGGAVAEVSKDFTLSNDSLYNTNWVNVVDYGADPTGVSNSATAFSNAISTGKNVFVPVGTFLITGSTGATPLLALQAGQSIFGTGVNSIIKTTTNARILDITTNCIVQNLKFLGSGNNSTAAQYQSGIYAAGTDATGWSIQNCTFEKLGGSTAIDGGGIIIEQIGASYTEGGRISNCRFVDIYYGIALDTRAEYVNISNIKITDANTGIYFASGNVNISNADVQDCVTGLKAFGGANNGHCVVSNSTFNHNTTNIDVEDLTSGHTFSGVMAHSGNIIIEGSTGLRFVGCDISSGTATLTGNTNISRVGSRWLTMTTSLVSGEDFSIVGEIRNNSTANYWAKQLTADTTAFFGPIYHNGITPASASASDSVWTKDATTKQWKLRAQSDIGGSSLTTTDNNLDITGSVLSTQKTVQTLTYGATTTWDMSTGYNAEVTLTGNATLDIDNVQEGDYGTITVFQDGTGSRLLAVTNGIVTLNSAPNDSTVLTFYYDGNSYAWRDNAKIPFYKSITYANPTSADNIAFWKTDVAITISKVTGVVVGTSSPSVTYQINFDSDRSDGTPSTVYASGQAVTSTTTGDEDTSFADATIPAGSWIWISTSAQSGTVSEISITIKYTID